MKLIYIIGIILILTFPSISTGYSSAQTSAPASSSMEYNFSSLIPGSFPANMSWIGFSVLNSSASSSVQVSNANAGTGLTVSTVNYGNSNDTYLDIRIDSGYGFNLKLTFSWNYNNSVFYTGDNLILENRNQTMLHYQLGPDYGNNLYLNANTSVNLGAEPNPFNAYTLDIAGNQSSGSIYTNVLQGWNESMHVPYVISAKNPYSGSGLNILIGGASSNLTLYNLYLGNGTLDFAVPVASIETGLSSTNFTAPSGLTVDSNSSFLPVADWIDNSLLFWSKTSPGSIEAYNFYNQSVYTLFSFPNGSEGLVSAGDNNAAFFLIRENSGNVLYEYNFTTGSVASNCLNSNTSGRAWMIPDGNSVYILYSNGSVTLMNSNESWQVSTWNATTSLGLPVSGGISANNLLVSFFNSTTGNISVLSYGVSGKHVIVEQYSTRIFGSVEPAISTTHPEPFSLLEFNESTGTVISAMNYVNSTTTQIVTSNTQYIASSGNLIPYRIGNTVHLSSSNSDLLTNINPNSSFISFSENGSIGLSLQNRTLTVFHKSPSPYSGENITLALQPAGRVTGNVSIKYEVNSAVNYSIRASVGNLSIQPSGGYLNFTTSYLSNGTQELVVDVTDIAGYSASVVENITVDNYVASVAVNPIPGSKILVDSRMNIFISGLSGPITSVATFSGYGGGVFTGSEFNITAPSVSGNTTLFLNITDQYGRTLLYAFGYSVVSDNTSGFKTDISPDSYLKSGNLNLSWTGLSYVDFYSILITSYNHTFTYNESDNFTEIQIPSGNYGMAISAYFKNGTDSVMYTENFTVQTFNPELLVKKTQGYYFSFFGDSRNSTLSITADSNVSAVLWINVSRDSQFLITSKGRGNSLNLNLTSAYQQLSLNGIYVVNITAREMSGRENNTSFDFSVNKSVPNVPIQATTLYYNNSSATLPVYFEPDLKYSYTEGNSSSPIILDPSYPTINLTSLYTNVTVTSADPWGNYNSSSVELVYSQVLPVISIATNGRNFVWSKVVTVSYSVKDPVKLVSVSLYANNVSINETKLSDGSLRFTLQGDGTYNISIEALDICGNINTSRQIKVNSSYYPEISSVTTDISLFMGVAHITSVINGTELGSVNVSWEINSKVVSNQSTFWYLLLPGSYNISLVLTYHGKSVLVSRNESTFGFVPETAFLAAIAIFLFRRNYFGSKDENRIKEFITGRTGLSRNSLIAQSRKAGLSRHKLIKTLDKMVSEGELTLNRDPDGNLFVMKK